MHWNEYIKMLHKHLSHSKEGEERKHQEGSAYGFKLFLKFILKRVPKVGPISILIANFNLNFATIMYQTVYAVY